MNKLGISIHVQNMGKDCVFMVGGGAAHIGAAATAYWERGDVNVQLAVVPGHKEDELVKKWALEASRQLKQTVTVIMGIHFDNASREIIVQAVEETDEMMRITLNQLLAAKAQQE